MKALMIFGSMVGFLIGCSSAFTGLVPWSTALWRGSAAALAAFLLTRWWSGVWLEGLRHSMSQRRNSPPTSAPTLKSTAKL